MLPLYSTNCMESYHPEYSYCLSNQLLSSGGVQAPCYFGEVTSSTNRACKYLGGDNPGEYFCMKYDEIIDGMPENNANFSPAFGAGCGSTLFNPDRTKLLLAIKEG
jgi:hypothetical protein